MKATGVFLMALLAGTPVGGATFTVTNTDDSGPGSLRQAILDANAAAGSDTVAFNILGSGVHTISMTSVLPIVSDPVVIDGSTQPGYSGTPLIELTTGLASTAGLRVTAGASTIRALVINSFSPQISLTVNGGNLIEGCYIGTDPTGMIAAGGQVNGIHIQNSDGNTIGGTSGSAGNLISGNPGNGIYIIPADATVIQGNLIGTTADGMAALGNGEGITLFSATNTLVGGASAGARNLISGNSGTGIQVTQSGGGNRIQGNWIGTDISGTQVLPNNFGIDANFTASILIGGPAPGEGNVISGNFQAIILNNGINGSVIQGNLIGTDATGALPLPNNLSILLNTLSTTDVLIGGPVSGEGNVIAFNDGVPLEPTFPGGIWNLGLRNTIRGNSIHDNRALGLDNSDGNNGVDPNDPGDPDTGANEFQNFPIVSAVTVMGPEGDVTTRIQGVLHSTPSTIFTLDFYSNPACARFPREFLEGETYLGFGQTTTDGAGTGVFDVTLPVAVEPGARISATATDPVGNTSEFSQRIVFSISPASGPATGGLPISVSGTDFADPTTLTFNGAAVPVTFVNDHQLSTTSPVLSPGTVNDVVATTPDATTGTLVKGWVADFLDVPGEQQFYASVTTLVSNAITVGVGGGLYGVAQDTLRQQMAVFLLKARYGLCYVPPPCITPVFTDVPCSLSFAPWINELVAEGITGGCGDGTTYCPANPVLRQQMAVLLLRTLEGIAYTPPACTNATFGDVPCSSPFAPWIYELVARNITAGCGSGNYCPTLSANRGQMAVFVVKTFSLQ